jgi:hypothetical protein
MPDDLRFCASGCCRSVNNRAITKGGYELAARSYQLGLSLSEPVETLIPCRKAAGRIQYAVESRLGFYLGLRLPRASGIPALGDKNLVVFDQVTGDFLRAATDEDVRKWNTARRLVLSIVRSVRDEIPSLLQMPLGEPKV